MVKICVEIVSSSKPSHFLESRYDPVIALYTVGMVNECEKVSVSCKRVHVCTSES